tara:strand:+ start:21807 stop:22742 length:936 start_codon:yes stop_codon:yes gene_type:complete
MSEIKKFLKLSKSVGEDFNLIQGPGGNTSYKDDNLIYIKKSGSFLSESEDGDIFIVENIKELEEFYKLSDNYEKFNSEMSIETPLHIIFKEKYVFHYHSLLSIIISTKYKLELIKKFCFENNISWIPYKRPGTDLAKEVLKNISEDKVKIYFLQNHGMLIASNSLSIIDSSIKSTEALFKNKLQIDGSLRFDMLHLINSNSQLFEYSFKEHFQFENLEKINDKYFFPDHAVFGSKIFQKYTPQMNIENDIVYYQNNKIFVKKPLTNSEIEVISSVLQISNFCEDIENFIDLDLANELLNSEDEILRINKNK